MTKKLFLPIIFLLVFKFSGANIFNTNLSDTSPPKIFNFRVEVSEPDRVYFDSDQPISGSSENGFAIGGKSITNLTINDGQLSNHYITVQNPFTFWDNNTIRYEGGSDITNDDNTPLVEFALTYIINNIPEPQTSKDRYVTVNASGGGDGTSEDSAWTLSEAFSNATTGTTVWIKAGNYGNENISLSRNGNAVNPIKFVGYKNTPGDINSMYYSYGDGDLDASEMPLLSGNNGDAIVGGRVDYVILRNIQVQNYDVSFYNNGGRGVIFDNCIVKDGGSRHFGYGFYVSGAKDSRITNSIAINSTGSNFSISGNNNLMKNLKSYSNNYSNPTDYYFGMGDTDNISLNTYAKRDGDLNHTGHGMSVQTSAPVSNDIDPERTQYNLIENHTGVNIGKILEFRHGGVRNNVGRHIYGYPEGSGSNAAGWIEIRDNASSNIIESSVVESPSGIGIFFSESVEIGVGLGHNNTIRNSIFKNCRSGIYAQSDNDLGSLTDNKFYNNVFFNVDLLIDKGNSNFDMSGNEFINNIVVNSNNLSNISLWGWIFENSNFYNSFSVPSGANNVSLDPKFVSNNDFRLTEETPVEIAEGGKTLDVVQSDFDGKSRTVYYSMGAFEYGENTSTGYIEVDAGEDTELCKGSETVLTATGNGDFLWSTGETTASITVSPEETTTYTVTVSDGENSASDEVIVTVNEPPTVTLGEDISVCSGIETTLTAEGTGEFLWSTGETTASITINPTETTTYSVAAKTACGDEVTDEIIVNVTAEINLDAGEDVSICSASEVVLTAQGSDNYLWSTGETTASITVTPSETTTYTVETTIGECKATDNVTITISESPQINLGDDVTVCSGSDVTLTAEGIGNFLWNTGETSKSITVSPSDTTTYIATASLFCGNETLSVTDTLVVNVVQGVTLDAGKDVTVCNVEEVTLTANSSSGEYMWNTGETTASITVKPTKTTTYTVTSGSGDCTVLDEVTVTVGETPTVNLGSDIDICAGSEIVLTAEGVGDFLWNTGETTQSITVNPTETTTYSITSSTVCDGQTFTATDEVIVNVSQAISLSAGEDITICGSGEVILTAEGNGEFLWNTGETTASITVNPTETTTYSVTSTSGTCSLTDNVTVTVDELPTVSLGEDLNICFGDEITLTAEGNGDFLWSTGDRTKSILVSPLSTTTYSVSASSCNETVTDDIVVNVGPEIIVNAGTDQTICKGESVTLTAQGNGNFLWSTGETTASITVSPNSTKLYRVISTIDNCSVTDEVFVYVENTPSVNLGDDISICQGERVTLIAEGEGNFLWSTGETTSTISVKPNSTTTYSVIASSSCNTDATDQITVNVYDPINADAGDSVVIEEGQSIQLTASGGNRFLWSTGETTGSIMVQPNTSTVYTVEVSNADSGCSDTDTVEVAVISNTADDNLNTDNADLTINSGAEEITICSGDEITLTAKGALHYLWNTKETSSSIKVNPEETTTYHVSALKNGVLETAKLTIVVRDCSSNKIAEFNIYPNPTEGIVNIHLPSQKSKVRLQIISLNGQLVLSKEVKADRNGVFTQIDLTSISKGVYLLKMDNDNLNETKKILVI